MKSHMEEELDIFRNASKVFDVSSASKEPPKKKQTSRADRSGMPEGEEV